MNSREEIEIMAPVGSYESLMAAIQGGANAVYFGIEQLNMRARSSANFTAEDLPKIVSIAHSNSMKAYLTINTIIYNEELDQMRKIIDLARDIQIDAVIVSDQSALNYAVQSGIEVHLSTQLNISNLESLKFYAGFADVVVLARELTLKQIKEISDGIREQNLKGPSGNLIRIELFVHGAMCMAISGKCYLSLHEHNHSANRGDCFQVCRSTYRVTDNEREIELNVENEHIMSPKDLSTIHFLNKILDAGVGVLKIEGRARSPEYVKTVVSCYNEAVEAYLSGGYGQEQVDHWNKRLASVFNRGFWDGYYLGQRLGEWTHVYGSAATQKKQYLGKCTNYFDRIGVGEFSMESGELKLGEEILIIGPTTGVIESTVEELRVDEKPVDKTSKGDRFSLPLPELVRRSDKLYKIVLTNS